MLQRYGIDGGMRRLCDATVLCPPPQLVWKAYIDFEIERFQLARARALYERLLTRSKAAKVWLSFASFEGAVAGDAALARAVYSAAYAHFRSAGAAGREERLLIVEAWLAFERAVVEDEVAHGGDGSASAPFLSAVQARVPSRVVRKRELTAADGSSLGWEEYYDYVFPDDEVKPAALKLLELAHKWRSSGGGVTSTVLHQVPADDDASAEALASEAGPGASRKRARLTVGEAAQQDVRAEVGDADDTVFQREIERDLEAAVHEWPVTAGLGSENLAVIAVQTESRPPRDLYCEEDMGDAADRDAVA